MAQEFKQIDPRYHCDKYPTDETMAEAKVSVGAAMDALFGVRKYQEGDGGGSGWTSGLGGTGNGMPSSAMSPSESPAWRRRIEKARREIAEHSAEIRVRELAESITFEELQNDLQEIRKWANSLQQKAA